MPNLRIPTPRITNLNPCPDNGYETNKFKLKSNVEGGNPPWVVAWAEDISEKDVLLGIVAGGISVFAANPGPFLAWVEQLVDRTISTLINDGQKKFPDAIKDKVIEASADIIKDAIKGRSARETLKEFDTVDFKAGAIQYSGKNKVCGQTISNTWGLKPYIAFRWR